MQGPRQLRVTVISAYNMPKKSGFRDHTDPFVEIQIGAQKQRTSTKANAGSEAQFDEALMFAYNGESYATINLYDDDSKKDDLLGSARMDLTPDLLHKGHRGTVAALDKKDRVQGEVLIAWQPC
eukprot:Blabericola_migrator_1__10626@NODE_6049_length_612_cov_1363_583486_g4034_i0_p1_GENE_NODE_6049_length_612_cov_1363_583486_g4034_i0NODE_6049_length_612_cov_1363_583486_g4034_i0_p1_ORF_typecomplete_len124_score25_16C2/PF00168_30/1_5e16_NODE_6049_length_612_cov_1363_583486_g4034_i0125496